MSTKSRSDRILKLHKAATKNFTPVEAPKDRNVLEHLLFACCLEDANYEAAEEAFHRLQDGFFDWNEVRVTTVTELCETLHNLPKPREAASRIKKNLQSLFETRYSFDLDDMIRMNQGKAVQELEAFAGMSKFVLGYIIQNAFGGHSIPLSKTIMKVMLATEIVTEAEAAKEQVPSLERTIAKSKGKAFASCLHQLAVLLEESPNSKTTKAIMKEAGAKEPAKPKKKAAAKKVVKKAATKKAAKAPTAKKAPVKKKVAKKAAKKTVKRKPK